MYKYFVKSEMQLKNPPGKSSSKEINPNMEMGLIGKVDETRKKLEDLFNQDIS